MKKLFGILSAAVIAVAFTSCGGSSTPEKVTEKFLTHVNKQEFAEAKKLATGDAVELLGTLESFAAMGGESAKAEAKAPEIKDMKCDTKETEAKCTYTVDGTEGEITLTKVEDEWKVSKFPKENAGGDDSIEEPADDVVEEADTTSAE